MHHNWHICYLIVLDWYRRTRGTSPLPAILCLNSFWSKIVPRQNLRFDSDSSKKEEEKEEEKEKEKTRRCSQRESPILPLCHPLLLSLRSPCSLLRWCDIAWCCDMWYCICRMCRMHYRIYHICLAFVASMHACDKKLKKIWLSDCLKTVWGIFLVGLKIWPTCFFTTFANGFFFLTVFCFHTKMKWEAGLIYNSETCFFQCNVCLFCELAHFPKEISIWSDLNEWSEGFEFPQSKIVMRRDWAGAIFC